MATEGGPSPPKMDRKLHLTCPLCLDIFTDPKMVPGCLHTFCLKCLEKLATHHHNTGTFPCPECRAEVKVPDGGVKTFQTNRFYHPDDLDKARGGIECATHPKMELDTYCVNCNKIICPKCALNEHKPHTTKEIHEAAREAKGQLAQDTKRLQEAVSYMTAEVQSEKLEQQAIDDKMAALETAILNKHALLMTIADKYRDEMLASLRTTRDEIQQDVSKQLKLKESNLQQICQLQQQAEQAVTGDRPQQLLNLAKEMKDGKGSPQAIGILKTPKRKVVTRPVLTFKVSEDVGRKQMEEFMQGRVEKVTMESTSPEVTVKKEIQCGPEKDIEVFSLCPVVSGHTWLSYARKVPKEDSPPELFSQDGKFDRRDDNYRGKVSQKARRNQTTPLIKHKNGDWTNTMSKSPAPLPGTYVRLAYSISSGTSNVIEATVVSDNPFKSENKTLFAITQPGPQRAFDVDSSRQLFVVLEDVQAPEKRRVHLYQRDQKKAVATYTPPSPNCQPSDVCFMKLGGQEVLIVADEGTDSLHVVRAQAQTGSSLFWNTASLTFLRYLTTDRPLLVQPTALNTDFKGRLWVACRGGTILSMTPVK